MACACKLGLFGRDCDGTCASWGHNLHMYLDCPLIFFNPIVSYHVAQPIAINPSQGKEPWTR